MDESWLPNGHEQPLLKGPDESHCLATPVFSSNAIHTDCIVQHAVVLAGQPHARLHVECNVSSM